MLDTSNFRTDVSWWTVLTPRVETRRTPDSVLLRMARNLWLLLSVRREPQPRCAVRNRMNARPFLPLAMAVMLAAGCSERIDGLREDKDYSRSVMWSAVRIGYNAGRDGQSWDQF